MSSPSSPSLEPPTPRLGLQQPPRQVSRVERSALCRDMWLERVEQTTSPIVYIPTFTKCLARPNRANITKHGTRHRNLSLKHDSGVNICPKHGSTIHASLEPTVQHQVPTFRPPASHKSPSESPEQPGSSAVRPKPQSLLAYDRRRDESRSETPGASDTVAQDMLRVAWVDELHCCLIATS